MTREGGVAGGGARNNRWLIYTKCSWRGVTVSSAQLYVWFTIRALWVSSQGDVGQQSGVGLCTCE